MPSEFTLDGVEYRTNKMSVMTQVHISRRLAAVIPALRELATNWVNAGTNDSRINQAVTDAGKAIGGLSDEDTDYVIGHCMELVQRRDPKTGGWMNVWHGQTNQPMFDDLDMSNVLNITGRVLAAEFVTFFRSAAPNLQADPPNFTST